MTKQEKDLLDFAYGKMQDVIDYMHRLGIDGKNIRLYTTADTSLGVDGIDVDYIAVDLYRYKDREKGEREYGVCRTTPVLSTTPNYFEFKENKYEWLDS